MGAPRIASQVGVRYGRLVVTADPGPGGRRPVTVACDCGETVEGVRLGNLRNGHIVSCGCHRVEVARTIATRRAADGGFIHGGNGTPLHGRWESMRSRSNGRKPGYEHVKCDPRWATFEGFRDNPPTTGRPFAPDLVLARFGDQGDYTPENTRWLTKHENHMEMLARRYNNPSLFPPAPHETKV